MRNNLLEITSLNKCYSKNSRWSLNKNKMKCRVIRFKAQIVYLLKEVLPLPSNIKCQNKCKITTKITSREHTLTTNNKILLLVMIWGEGIQQLEELQIKVKANLTRLLKRHMNLIKKMKYLTKNNKIFRMMILRGTRTSIKTKGLRLTCKGIRTRDNLDEHLNYIKSIYFYQKFYIFTIKIIYWVNSRSCYQPITNIPTFIFLSSSYYFFGQYLSHHSLLIYWISTLIYWLMTL